MIRQFKQSRAVRQRVPAVTFLAFVGAGSGPEAGRGSFAEPHSARRLPRRPDGSVISEAIPLFYIGRNKNGLWVAREVRGLHRRHLSNEAVRGAVCQGELRAHRMRDDVCQRTA